MGSRRQQTISPYTSGGEPRSGDVAITVLTALFLLGVLIVIAIL